MFAQSAYELCNNLPDAHAHAKLHEQTNLACSYKATQISIRARRKAAEFFGEEPEKEA
jgi:hypothetical protein